MGTCKDLFVEFVGPGFNICSCLSVHNEIMRAESFPVLRVHVG